MNMHQLGRERGRREVLADLFPVLSAALRIHAEWVGTPSLPISDLFRALTTSTEAQRVKKEMETESEAEK